MSRLKDRRRFYALMDALCRRCGGMQFRRNARDRMSRFERGVCFFFDPSERRTDSGNGPRVVHIGTQAPTDPSGSALGTGFRQHRGTFESSQPDAGNGPHFAFGQHVGAAMVARKTEVPGAIASWGQESRGLERREHLLEPGAGMYIGELPYLWLRVPDQPGGPDLQGIIQRNAIALLSNSGKRPLDPASEAWLGSYSDQPAIRDSHLWNVDHVDEIHDPAFLELVADLVGVGKPGAGSSAFPLQDHSKRDGPGFGVRDVVTGYDASAHSLVPRYEHHSFEAIHAPVLDLLPGTAGSVLDVGAGSGRDVAWFAARGHQVLAVEPSAVMRAAGKACHGSARIRWIDDSLPALDKVLRSKLSFDLVWLSAVWMHVPPGVRTRAFRKLVSAMRSGGSMMLSLRQGPPPPGRPMATATASEVEALARQHGLQTIRTERRQDAGGRADIWWEVIWLRLPDDGTGALPLLRHVVFNDRKSSTYKLALLRALIRIADGAGGFARPGQDDRHMDLPLGLVALYWVRAFRRLLDEGLPQHPKGNERLGFVKAGFRGLQDRSPHDLRVGQRFTGRDAENLILAIREAANCIRRMPATFIKYPGSSEPIFPCKRHGPVQTCSSVRLDEAFLWSLGTLSVPLNLWRAMGRYAAWIEPAVLGEWSEIMRGYKSPASLETHMSALRWLEHKHDTEVVRELGKRLQQHGSPLFCVWTGSRLTQAFDVDHCFPFAAWPCNDLWNLLPSSPTANRKKSDLLPSPAALEQARPRMLEWWDRAYIRNSEYAGRFEDESRSALPLAVADDGALSLESLFEGVMIQQMVLKRDQQIAEWPP